MEESEKEFLSLLHKLKDCDELFSETKKNLAQAWTDHRYFKTDYLKTMKVIGSTIEGSSISRLFSPVDSTRSYFPGINSECEVDVDMTLCEIPIELKHMIVDIPNEKGFVKCFITNDTKMQNVFKEDFISRYVSDGYLDSYKVRTDLLSRLTFKDKSRRFPFLVSIGLQIDPDRVTSKTISENITKATAEINFDVYIDNLKLTGITLDYLLRIKLNWWPNIAGKWLTRERKWPSPDVISDLTKSCYIICKTNESEFLSKLCYSFSNVEQELVKKRSEQQKFIYFLFKIIFYLHLKPIEHDTITSYICKTTMLYVCEQNPPESDMWIEDTSSTINTLSTLFKQLHEAFSLRKLEYFFIPEINILNSIPNKALEEAEIKLLRISENVMNYFPKNIRDVIDAVYTLHRAFSIPGDMLKAVYTKDFECVRHKIKPEFIEKYRFWFPNAFQK